MSPEWQRRVSAIFFAVIFAAIIRKIEPRLAREVGIDKDDAVWITRICAVAILTVCFKLTDTIPDEYWRFSIWRPRAVHVAMVAVGTLMLALFYGAAH